MKSTTVSGEDAAPACTEEPVERLEKRRVRQARSDPVSFARALPGDSGQAPPDRRVSDVNGPHAAEGKRRDHRRVSRA